MGPVEGSPPPGFNDGFTDAETITFPDPVRQFPLITPRRQSAEATEMQDFPDSLMTELRLAGSTITDTCSLTERMRGNASKHLKQWDLDGTANKTKRERFVPTIRLSQEWASPLESRHGKNKQWPAKRPGQSFRQAQPTKPAISDTAWNLASFKHDTHEPQYVRMADRSLQQVYNLRQPEMRDLQNNDVHLLSLINNCKMRMGT
jgi:hypothetical protein